MRPARAGAALLIAAATLLLGPPVAQAAPVHYYLALGDSLSRGYLAATGADSDQGYPDQAYPALRARDPALRLVKLGCSGETTATMLAGGRCRGRYPAGHSQLAAAQAFVRAHPGAVRYLSLDIGANDVASCALTILLSPACLNGGLAGVRRNLPAILSGLTSVDRRAPVSVGLSYYDPFVAAWLLGPAGRSLALATVGVVAALDAVEAAAYRGYGFRVADGWTALHTAEFGQPRAVAPYGTLPRTVAEVCTYTAMCARQDFHPTPRGYQLLAAAVSAALLS